MVLAHFQKTIVDDAGNIISGASVRVEHEQAGTPLAVLYEDRDGTTVHSQGNPITTNSEGDADFYVAGGSYRITITSSNFNKTLRYVGIGLASETDGVTAGIPYKFSTNTVASDPGSGFLKFDNSTLASVTTVYVSGTDQYSSDIQDFLATISTGTLYLRTSDGDAFIVASVTGAGTDQGDYYSFPVTVVDSGGQFLGSENIGFLAVTDGVDGVSSGINYTFDTSTDTASDPGTGDVRFNNASFASVTEIAFDDNSSITGNPDISAFLATWDDSTATVKGTVTISKAEQPQNFAIYQVTATSDATTHYRVTVTHVASNGSFSNTDDLILNFSRTGDDGADGSDGNDGNDGSDGADGVSSGIVYTFDTSTDTASDPGTGDVRFNNGTLASVTEAAFDDNNAESGNPDISAFLATWDDSTNTSILGQLIIKVRSDTSNFVIFDITSVTDATTHYRVGVTHVQSNGSFSNTDPVSVEFYRAGDKGTDGAGAGDVIGPESGEVVNRQLAIYEGTTGKIIGPAYDPSGSPQDPITENNIFVKQGGETFNEHDGLAVDEDGKINGISNGFLASIAVTFDGGGSALEAGLQYRLQVPFACVITGWTMLADQSGFAVVDIWKDVYANYPPDNSDSITAGNEPTLYDEASETDDVLTGWTVEIAAGDTLIFNLDSTDVIQQLTLNLNIRKT